MDVHTVLAAVDLQVQRVVADDAAAVPRGLTDLGWTADPVAVGRAVTGAGVFHGQIHHLIHPRLLDAGFTLTGPDESSLLWSGGHTAVDLSLLRRIHQRTHSVPSAGQFAVYPLQHVSQPGLNEAAAGAATAGRRGFA